MKGKRKRFYWERKFKIGARIRVNSLATPGLCRGLDKVGMPLAGVPGRDGGVISKVRDGRGAYCQWDNGHYGSILISWIKLEAEDRASDTLPSKAEGEQLSQEVPEHTV